MQVRFISSLATILVVASSARVNADHHKAGQVEAALRTFYTQLSTGQFDDAMDHIKLGASGYLPDGVVASIPTEEVRQTVVNSYKEAHEGGMEMTLRPEYINVKMYGNVAVATYLVDGMIKENDDAEEEHQVNRGSLVWQETDQGWKIVHWHVSKLTTEDDD